MSMAKKMLSVLMDGINDTQLLHEYAKDCEDRPDYERWFHQRAEKRLDMLRRDRDDIFAELDIERRSRDGDGISEALMCYVDAEIAKLDKEISR